MVSTEAGFGPCRGLVQSVCQPPVLPRSCLLPGQPQHLANPKLASDAKCSYFTVALLQETGSVYPPSPQKPALSQPRGTPQTPETKGRGRDGCPVWVCLCQIHSLPKLQPSPKSGVKPSPQVPEAEGTRGATYACTFPSREDAACRELGLPYPCSVADTEELCGQPTICGPRSGKPRRQHAVRDVVQAKELKQTPRAEAPSLAPSFLNNSASPNSLAGLSSHMRSQSKTRGRHLLRSK